MYNADDHCAAVVYICDDVCVIINLGHQGFLQPFIPLEDTKLTKLIEDVDAPVMDHGRWNCQDLSVYIPTRDPLHHPDPHHAVLLIQN